MDRRVFFGLIVIVIAVSAIALVLSLPEKPAGCVSNDGQCPSGCTYKEDTDCLRSTVTTGGEIRRCLADTDCVIVAPICGNDRCDFNDRECQTECSCEVAINKDYKIVFEAASTKCLPTEKRCITCPAETTSKAVCMNGECRITS